MPLALSISQMEKTMNGAPVELIEQRTANSKTFLMPDGRIGLDVSIGAIHYKDNYQDQTEPWKDIDCAIQPDGTIRKAPYDLDIDLNAIGFRCRVKEDGSEFAMGLGILGEGILPAKVKPIISGNQAIWRDVAPDTDIMIVAERTRISFRRILKSNLASVRAEFNVTKPSRSIAVLTTRARDADGEEIAVEATETKDRLIEQIDVRGKKFPIEIDPELDLQVGAGTDDCQRSVGTQDQWTLGPRYELGWGGTADADKKGSGTRFTNVTIPKESIITVAYITFTGYSPESGTTVNLRVSAEDIDDAPTFADDKTAFDNRFSNHTTARIDWDNLEAWAANNEYNTPEIKTVVQEIVDRAGWASGQDMVFFVEDFDGRTTAQGAIRRGYSYEDSTTKCAKLHIEYTPPVTEKFSSDTGSGADAYVSLEKSEAKSSSDAGSGAEGTPVPSATLAGSETGSGIEALIARLLAAFDAGTGAEVGGLLKDLLVSELGRGSDSLIAKIETPTKGGGMKLWI